MQHNVDLSSFPLLRIDQIPQHETHTLVESEALLSEIEYEGEIDSITPFISKLLIHVRKEIARRREAEAVSHHIPQQAGDCILPPSTSAVVTRQRPTQVKQIQSVPRRDSSPSPSFVVFSSPKLKSSSFRSRAKLAKASLQARSNEAVSLRREQERHDRTRQALDTMHEWRMEREMARKLREERLNEERRLRLERWNERIAREKQVHSLMHDAAEDAKAKALESGCTNEEALVEAAAAASRVVDDESTALQSVDTHSDDGSFTNDVCAERENLPIALQLQSTEFVRADLDGKCNVASNVDTDYCVSSCIDTDLQTKCPSAIVDSKENSNVCDDHETADNLLTEASMVGRADSSPNTYTTPLDISSSPLEELHIDGDAVTTYLESSDKVSSDIKDTDHNESHCHGYALGASIPFQTTDEINTRLVQMETESITSATEAKTTKIFPSRERRFGNKFPLFSSIFTNHHTKDSMPIDVKQRDLSGLLQYQIAQYAKMKTAFASLNDEVGFHLKDDSLESSDDSFAQGLFYRIHSHRPEVMSIIRTAFSDRLLSAWNELPSDVEGNAWNLLWVWGLPTASTFDNLLIFQKINRFRDTRGLVSHRSPILHELFLVYVSHSSRRIVSRQTRKDLLKKNIQRYCSGFSPKDEESFNIMPLTYALPHEFASFVSGYQSIQHNLTDKFANYWIIKPVGLSRGRGISIVNDIADVSYSRPVVIQRYITNPLCFMGYKFDLRMYILVTSFSPLDAFIYKEGLARFGSKPYILSPEALHDRRIHLTNSSVQQEYSEDIERSHPAYLAGTHGFESKTSFSWLWKRIEALGVDTDDLWEKLTDVCRKTLVAAGSDIQYQPNSFEIFGYDLMFDQNLKCWLIEVNSSPSLACESTLDTRIKGSLIRDTIALVNPPAYDRTVLSSICKRRLTHRQSNAKNICDSDVDQILMHKPMREFGEAPKRMGNYERLLPVSVA